MSWPTRTRCRRHRHGADDPADRVGTPAAVGAGGQPGQPRTDQQHHRAQHDEPSGTQASHAVRVSVPTTDLPEWARRLDLSPHPEGGWFRETWRSELTMPQSALPPDYTGPRSAGTAILFLLMPGQQSAWHTVRSAELWLYHFGGPLLLQIGAEQDSATTHLLGADILAGEQPQIVVPPGHWQRARPRDDVPCLVSCVVIPGFDYADFALAAPTD